MPSDDKHRSIEDCEAEIAHLKDENSHLRESAARFAELAERLMRSLESERLRALRESGSMTEAGPTHRSVRADQPQSVEEEE
jgi:hypothetical protein